MDQKSQERLRQKLLRKRLDLTARLERIQANLQRGLEADSAERAKQLEDSDVVNALGNDARLELEIPIMMTAASDLVPGTVALATSPNGAAIHCVKCAQRGVDILRRDVAAAVLQRYSDAAAGLRKPRIARQVIKRLG